MPRIKKIDKINISKWCNTYHQGDNMRNCCKCKKNFDIYFQVGDGLRIHSLCKYCYDDEEEKDSHKPRNKSEDGK